METTVRKHLYNTKQILRWKSGLSDNMGNNTKRKNTTIIGNDKMKIRDNRKLKFIVLILFLAFTVILVAFIALPLHELGHYIVINRSSENVSVTYDLSLTSWSAYCQFGSKMSETDNILSSFAGGLFSGGLLGLLWLFVFGFERNLHHMNLNFALIFVSIKEIAIGISEGVTTIFGIFEWHPVIARISTTIILIILIYKYSGRLAQWVAGCLGVKNEDDRHRIINY